MATRRALLAAPAVLAAPALVATPAHAQAEPLRIIASFPPGAALDGIARLLADAAPRHGFGAALVDNRPGANGNIAAGLAARARADGRTLVMAIDTSWTVNPHLYPELGYDPAMLAPVAIAGTFGVVLLAHPSAGISDLAGFAAAARRAPLLYASGGNGSPGHLGMAWLGEALGLPATALEHVPFRGNAQAMAELLSGRVPAGFIALSGAAGHIRAGSLRALAVSTPARMAALPEVPTVAEQGVAGFDLRFAYILAAPAATPPETRAALARFVAEVLASEAGAARLRALATEPESGDGAAASAWIARAKPAWGRVVVATRMQLD